MSVEMRRPCPFCRNAQLGSAGSWSKSDSAGFWWYVCDRCKAQGPPAISEKDAEHAWNARSLAVWEQSQ